MDIKNVKILEALKMQPLSQEEMTARHILGRLYGPIATCIESTRNGRLYNKPLWEKALKDEIFLEKVATKALFLELGHPTDREETDMKQACACIPEVPKIVGDDLYAYVDILDTPNGRLLKTLVDYGFVPGISSRGSGDVMDNNQVDPETFFLETWDIVQLPAVKKARLNVCESLDSNSSKLKKALAESYKAAKEEDKDTMKKALENLNIDIKEELADETQAVTDTAPEQQVEWAPQGDPDLLYDHYGTSETNDDVLVEDTEDAEGQSTDEVPVEDNTTEPEDAATEDTTASDAKPDSEAPESEDTDSADDTKDVENAEDATDAVDMNTVGDAIDLLQEYDDDTTIEFEPITIDGVEHEVDRINSFVDDDGVLVLGVDCLPEEKAVEDPDSTEDDAASDGTDSNKTLDDTTEDETNDDAETDETDKDTESAEDNGDAEVLESLKEMVRQKKAMEAELNSLRKAQTVGDAKVADLQEKLNRYRQIIENVSNQVAEIPELQSQIESLTEQLTQSKATITKLAEQAKIAQQLNESMNADKAKVKTLTEEVSRLTEKSNTLEAKLEGQTKRYNEKLLERTEQAKSYKAQLIEAITRYVESKASMLGVQPSEITSRLNENYTLTDVDAVCEQILDSTVTFSRLPFSGRAKTSARISESVSRAKTANTFSNPDYGYDIDDSLLELAGLKK